MIWSLFNSLSLPVALGLWGVELALLAVFLMRQRSRSVGLLPAYLIGLWLIHWTGALAVYASPTEQPADLVQRTLDGFRLTTLGLTGFVVGALLVPAIAFFRNARPVEPLPPEDPIRLVRLSLGLGAVAYVLSMTRLAALPGMAAILSAAKLFLLGGLVLFLWISLQRRTRSNTLTALLIAAMLPAVTLLSQGFLGYGIAALTLVLSFLGIAYRPRIAVIAVALVGVYAGASLFVTYMRDRTELRVAVWGAQDYGTRIDKVGETLDRFEWFDPERQKHWDLVMLRLNQNDLVGRAMSYTPTVEPFAEGETFWLAAVALVPRVIWPDKPRFAGSMGLVSKHTGLRFAAGTSVGIGQVMEFYVNFGPTGVWVGFLLFGMILTVLDRRAAEALVDRDYRRFIMFFLMGGAMLAAGGMLAEVTAAMLGGWMCGRALVFARPGFDDRSLGGSDYLRSLRGFR